MKLRALLLIYLCLLVLLSIMIGLALLPMAGGLKAVLVVLLAAAQAGVVALFAMQLRYQKGTVVLFVAAGAFCLLLLFVLTACDYLTRDWS